MAIDGMASTAAAPARTQAVEIPNRLYFRIGDVSRLTGVPAYVLRYWETEFSMLSPKKSGTNQRLYRRKDVEMVLEIKRLLYEKRFTIEGARSYLQHRPKAERAPKPVQNALFPAPAAPAQAIASVRAGLMDVLRLLEG